jgi:hypothetical protein
MSNPFIIVRRELAAQAIKNIAETYAEYLADIQAVTDGDGKEIKSISWGAITPQFLPVARGDIPQWTHQEIILELRASVDYMDRTLDSRYQLLAAVLEDFCARPDLESRLSNENIIVVGQPTFEEGAEIIENGKYVTKYSLRVSARGRMEGE